MGIYTALCQKFCPDGEKLSIDSNGRFIQFGTVTSS